MVKAVKLTLEPLEDRITPAAFSTPWPEASDLTLSFAPDGTSINGQPSNLFQMLDAHLPPQVWQTEILRAFQTWAVAANLNIGLVSDGGEPFGTLGLKEGDPRFGDIRIGAQAMAGDVLAVTDPYDPFVANTWVGDVFLNSSASFGIGTQSGSYDLESLLLHEAGHVLGLGHSDDPNSPMFPQFNKPHAGLTTADVAALQSLYGPRQPDAFEGAMGNDTFSTATVLSLGNPGSPAPAEIQGDITTNQDVDIYRIRVPAVASLDVKLNVAGESLLVPHLTVYDAGGHIVASALASSPLNNDLSLHLDHLTPGATYYIKVEGGTKDVFGIGTYDLAIDPAPAGVVTPSPVSGGENVPANPLADAQLLATTPWYVEHTYYEVVNTLTPAVPVHTYLVQSADLGPDMTNVMTVVVFSPEKADTHFRVRVLDDRGNPVDATVLLDDAGRLEVRVPNVLSARNYYVQVQDAAPILSQPTDFDVEVDFAQDATHLQTFVNQTLGNDQADYATTLRVLQSQQFHFVLSATDWNAPVETGVRMTIYDAAGRAVFTTSVADGASRSADVFLNAGQYTVRFTRANEQGGKLVPILFELSGMTASEPIGPQLRDTTLGPLDSAGGPVEPSVTFYWLPYTPIDLAMNGIPNSVPTDTVSVIAQGSPNPDEARLSLMQAGSQDLTPSVLSVNVVGMFIAQPPITSAPPLTVVSSAGTLNTTFDHRSSAAMPGRSYGADVLGISGEAPAESSTGSGQALVPSLRLEVHPGGQLIALEPFRKSFSSRQSASPDVAGRRAAVEPTAICNEIEISLTAESICEEEAATPDHSLLGDLFRVGGLPGLIFTLLFLHSKGLGFVIPRFVRAASRPWVDRRANSSGGDSSEPDAT